MFVEAKRSLARQLRVDPERVGMDALIKKVLGDDYGVAIPIEKKAKFETVGSVVNFLDSFPR